jgi:nucleotide-binding universal stress UspA family protein
MYRRVLVPLDGSPVAEAILPFLLEIAGPLDMSVVLLRVNEPIAPAVIEASRHVIVDDIEGRRRDALEYLAPIAVGLRARGVDVDTVVRRGEPATEILAAARETDADLVAMTTHGRTGLGRLLFGSVAEAVLRRAEVPVFLMRQMETPSLLRHMVGTGKN